MMETNGYFKFEKLDCWKNSKNLIIFIYGLTDKFPKSELFAITSQINRAAVSVSANIAEGCSRSSKKDFSHFLEISIGSCYELETLMIISFERGYISKENKEKCSELLVTIIKQTYGLKRKLNESK